MQRGSLQGSMMPHIHQFEVLSVLQVLLALCNAAALCCLSRPMRWWTPTTGHRDTGTNLRGDIEAEDLGQRRFSRQIVLGGGAGVVVDSNLNRLAVAVACQRMRLSVYGTLEERDQQGVMLVLVCVDQCARTSTRLEVATSVILMRADSAPSDTADGVMRWLTAYVSAALICTEPAPSMWICTQRSSS